MRQGGPHVPIFNADKKRGPHTPIFDQTRRSGVVSVGTQASGIYVPPPDFIEVLDTTAIVSPRGISASGNNLAVSRPFTDTMSLFDISDPTNIIFKDDLSSSSRLDACFNLVCEGNYIYTVANGDERVTVIDISNPTNIGFAGGPTTGTVRNTTSLFEVWDICKQGSYVFVTALDSADVTKGRVTIVDVSNPVTPTITGTVTDTLLADRGFGGVAHNSIEISGNHAFVAARQGAAGPRCITVVDVSNKAAPVVVHSYPNATLWSGNISEIFLEGNYLYVTGGSTVTGGNLSILNISNPLNITLASTTNIPEGSAQGLTKKGDFVYFCGSVLDIIRWMRVSNPSVPVYDVADDLINSALLNDCHTLDVEGDYLYATNIGAGTQTVASLTTLRSH